MQSAASVTTADLMDPDRFVARGYPHEAWAVLRREAPVKWFAFEGARPGFWAITKRADIVALSKEPEKFRIEPRTAVFAESPPSSERTLETRHLLTMDPPDHAVYRKLASAWFTPRAIEQRRPEIEKLARELLDALPRENEFDFVVDFAAPLTLSVLADMLGVPRDDWQRLFDWTNRLIGFSDPEFQQGQPKLSDERAARELFAYFAELAAERVARPTGDLTSVLASARVGGAPLPANDLLSYYQLLVAAGNETTRNAASGGLMALIDHPEEFSKLRANPGLVNHAVEEIVRWTTPVIQFCRTPIADFELRGQRIRGGESMCLFYASANRDEEAFPDPEKFRVDRNPNPHLGFGIGEHFCLGASLARLELRVIFAELAKRFAHFEYAAPPARMRSSFIGGVKRMRVRYRQA
ncbi:MAG TPA: cytochrome P450 [Myxococcota bacterium]|nr:cytochrome P450 [Myxococcota bacterium]